MSFWRWFTQNGDKVCNCLALLAVALKGVDGLSVQTTTILTIAGITATTIHQSFFPNVPQPPAKV